MNKVYISGTIADAPVFHQPEGGAAHLVFQLCVQHRTAKGATKRELYRVNAWNNAALWGKANLRQGQGLAVDGYLTQRVAVETGVICVEVTAEEFFPGASAPRARPDAQAELPRPNDRAESEPQDERETAEIAS